MKSIVILGLVMLAIAACAQAPTAPPAASGEVKEISIDAFSWGFTQSPADIKKGDRVRVTVTSSSGTHGVAIPDMGVATGRISPGGQEVIEFTATESGEIQYYCNIPCGSGHMHMRGAIGVDE